VVGLVGGFCGEEYCFGCELFGCVGEIVFV